MTGHALRTSPSLLQRVGLNHEQVIITQPASAADSKIATCSSPRAHPSSQAPSPWLLHQDTSTFPSSCVQNKTFQLYQIPLSPHSIFTSTMWSVFFNVPNSPRVSYFTQNSHLLTQKTQKSEHCGPHLPVSHIHGILLARTEEPRSASPTQRPRKCVPREPHQRLLGASSGSPGALNRNALDYRETTIPRIRWAAGHSNILRPPPAFLPPSRSSRNFSSVRIWVLGLKKEKVQRKNAKNSFELDSHVNISH